MSHAHIMSIIYAYIHGSSEANLKMSMSINPQQNDEPENGHTMTPLT